MKIKRAFLFLLLMILLIGAWGVWNIFGPVIQNPEKTFLYIRTGGNYQDVKDSLQKNNFINGNFWFDQIAKYVDYPQNVKVGKYKITNGMSLYHLMKMLRSGKQVPVNLVITKLRTKEDLAKRIATRFEVDSTSAMHFLNNGEVLQQFNVDTNTVMTDVIPNTYTYMWNTSMENIFSKLYDESKRFWNPERLQKAERLKLSPQEVYTLASIVEEETNEQDDKGKIASVYMNRLRKGMKLAADPTVKFAMRDFALKRIYHKYLEFVSPYNTYLNAGLPPGPICTPSIKTIDAVLDLPETDYLFFVARPDFSGYSDFASTYSQHQVNAKAYQQALDSLIKSKQENQ